MPDLLLRKIPKELHSFFESTRKSQNLSQREFFINLLQRVKEDPEAYQPNLFIEPHPSIDTSEGPHEFTFIDLFAGIGGFRLGLEKTGGKCLFTCEWDRYAQKTYNRWFGDVPHGDIRELDISTIPDHDIMAAGFPCQPFSIAGVSKKKSLGRAHGFKDITQGTLFFQLATIAETKRPPVLFFENVKNLKSHDSGRTWQIIEGTLTDLGYKVFHKIVDAKLFVPQHRERILIVGFDKKIFGENVKFEFPDPRPASVCLKDILEPAPDAKYTLSDHLWSYLQKYAEKHKAKGNGFGFGLANLDGTTRTLSARYYKDGSEILIPQGKGQNPRRLTPREAARLMGFPDDLPIAVSDTQAYKQFGNAVCPHVITMVAKEIVKVIKAYKTSNVVKERSRRYVARSEKCLHAS